MYQRPGVYLLFVLLAFTRSYMTSAQLTQKKEPLISAGIIFFQDSILAGGKMSYSLYVQQILPNSPASKTDIKYHDKLVSMNGIMVDDMKKDIEKIQLSMFGKEGSSISIELERSEPNKKTIRVSYVIELISATQKNKARVFGIGVTLFVDSIILEQKLNYVAKVQIVYPFSPAESVGLESGDFIIEVEGHAVDGSNPNIVQQIMNLILAEEPSKIQFVFLRKVDEQYVPFQVKTRRTDISKYINLGIQNFPSLIREAKKEELTKEEQAAKAKNDIDGDGIPNKEDACPEEAGVESMNPYENGCPDKR